MNNPPSGDGKSTEKKVNYRIPKVSNLEKRLRHVVSNSTTALAVDLTQDMSNSTSNKARSAFSRADPWRGEKEEMTIFLNFVPKYLARNSKTEAASDILTQVWNDGVDLLDRMPPVEENPAVAGQAARGQRPAVMATEATGVSMEKRRWYSEEEKEDDQIFDAHAAIWTEYCTTVISGFPCSFWCTPTAHSSERLRIT